MKKKRFSGSSQRVFRSALLILMAKCLSHNHMSMSEQQSGYCMMLSKEYLYFVLFDMLCCRCFIIIVCLLVIERLKFH